MKFKIVLVVLLLFIGCSNTSTRGFIPEEFNYPDKSIGNGKTFVYKNSVTNEENYTDIQLIVNDGKTYRTIKRYERYSISDSAVVYNGETVEVYNFFMSGDGKKIKGEKLQDTIIDTPKRIGTHLTRWLFHSSSLTHRTNFAEKYIRDTSLNWKNQQLPCLETEARGNVTIQENSTASRHKITVTVQSYYAQGIGLIRNTIEFTDHNDKFNSNTWDLVDIKHLK